MELNVSIEVNGESIPAGYLRGTKSEDTVFTYDMVSTVIYPSCTRNMAFSIGGEYSLDKIDVNVLKAAAAEAGLSKKQAMKSLYRLCGVFEEALHSAAEELEAYGIPGTSELEEKIAGNGCFHRFSR